MDALIFRPVALSDAISARCFCCRERFEADRSCVHAFDIDGDDRGPVCPSCASAQIEVLRERMRESAHHLLDWVELLMSVVNGGAVRRGIAPPRSDVH
jgi:hypothetical protein